MKWQRDLPAVHQLVDRALLVSPGTDAAHTADAVLGAGGGQSLHDPRVAEDALLRLGDLLVEVDLLVRAGGNAVAVPAAALLIDQDDSIFLSLVDRIARA